MKALTRCLCFLLGAVMFFSPVANASESADEAELAAITVMVSGTPEEGCSPEEPAKCPRGAGIILAIDRDGYPLVYTARHLAHPDGLGDKPMLFTVRLRSGETISAESKWESDARLDVMVLRLKQRPRHMANLTCRPIAIVSELTSQTELVAVGSPNWQWSRLNRFNRANDEFVYIETPADRDGLSGGPVFVRGTLELVGLYQEGAQGIVQVVRLDALPDESRPEKLAGDSKEDPALLGSRSRTLGCPTKTSRLLTTRDTTLRLGIGLAQLDSSMQQLASPLATLEIGADAWLADLGFLTLSLYGSLQLGASYFDRGDSDRTFYGQGFFNMGLRIGVGPGFLDALWAPGAHMLGDDLSFTARSFRVALGRRMGDGVAGLIGGYVSRSGEPGIATLEIFSDFAIASAGGVDMPGIPYEPTGDKRVDRLLARERSEKMASVGGVITTASDRRLGWGGGVGAVEVAPLNGAFGVSRTVATHLRETLEFQFGSVRVKDGNHFYFGYAAEIGVRTRFGLPHSLLVDLFYYLPIVTFYEDRFRFPLVGAGAGVGYKVDSFGIRAVYKYQMTKVIYSTEPNLTFAGLSAQVDL